MAPERRSRASFHHGTGERPYFRRASIRKKRGEHTKTVRPCIELIDTPKVLEVSLLPITGDQRVVSYDTLKLEVRLPALVCVEVVYSKRRRRTALIETGFPLELDLRRKFAHLGKKSQSAVVFDLQSIAMLHRTDIHGRRGPHVPARAERRQGSVLARSVQ